MPSESSESTGRGPSTSALPGSPRPVAPAQRWTLPPEQVARYAHAVPDILFAMDTDGTLLWTNQPLGNPLGYQPDEPLASNGLDLLHPEDLEAAAAAMEAGSTHPERIIPANFRLRTASGDWRWFELHARFADDDPDVAATVVVARSVDHRVAFDAAVTALASGASASVVATHLALGLGRPDHHRHGAVNLTGDDAAGRTVIAPTLAEVLGGATADGDTTDLAPGPWLDAVTTGAVVTASDDELPEDVRRAAEQRGLRCCVALPVPDPGSARSAAMLVWLDDPAAANATAVWAAKQAAPLLEVTLQRRADHRRLVHAATHDSLTGLANRRHFLDVLAGQASTYHPDRGSSDEPLALLYLDLDHFKPVNDRRGHETGDHVLAAMADRLRRSVRPGDLLARIGGDEFAVLCPGLDDPSTAGRLAEALLDAIRGPVLVGAHAEQIGVSIGIAMSPPIPRDRLLSSADAAMYEAKGAGRNRWRIAAAPALD